LSSAMGGEKGGIQQGLTQRENLTYGGLSWRKGLGKKESTDDVEKEEFKIQPVQDEEDKSDYRKKKKTLSSRIKKKKPAV